jgi:hypothetical protein
VGCSAPDHVEELSDVGKPFAPMDLDEQSGIIELFEPAARSLAFYRGVL